MELKNKVAIVTGGASGLGEGTVRAFLARGMKVAIFDLNEKRGQSIVEEFGEDKVAFFSVDVTSEESVSSAIESAVAKFGRVSVCNNFAGINIPAKTVGRKGPHGLDNYLKVLNVNLIGTFNVCRLVAAHMAENPPYNDDNARGVITNTASIAAFEGQIGQVAYSASKGGVVGMTLPMARDLASVGIRVNTIAPGLIHTPLFEELPEEVYQSLEQSVIYPKRLGRPEEVAQLAVLVAENEYMNGECIRIDGAIRMQSV